MYVLNKIVGFLVSPIGGTIVGAVVVLACRWLNWRCLAKWVGYITVVWLWLWMTPIMTRIVGFPLESEFLVDGRVPTVESFPSADAIVLHGGSMGIQTNLSAYAEMWGSADRVWHAARLWKAGKASKIIATGDGAKESTLGLLMDLGVDERQVLFKDAKNTEQEAKAIAATDFRCLMLVTSAWHMKRTRMMFEKFAPSITVICAPSDFEYSRAAAKPFSIVELLPDSAAFMLNCVALHEWVGIIGYKLFR